MQSTLVRHASRTASFTSTLHRSLSHSIAASQLQSQQQRFFTTRCATSPLISSSSYTRLPTSCSIRASASCRAQITSPPQCRLHTASSAHSSDATVASSTSSSSPLSSAPRPTCRIGPYEPDQHVIVRKGELPSNPPPNFHCVPSGFLNTYRILQGFSSAPHELQPEKSLPLEHSLIESHGVSFDKGCYLGQELTARTHHQGVVRKKVWPVHLRPTVDVPPHPHTTPVTPSLSNAHGGWYGHLADMRVIRIAAGGSNAATASELLKYLHNLATIDVYSVASQCGGKAYSMFLNSKGRILFDGILSPIEGDSREWLASAVDMIPVTTRGPAGIARFDKVPGPATKPPTPTPASAPRGFYLTVHASLLPLALAHLNQFNLRRKVAIADLSETRQCWQVIPHGKLPDSVVGNTDNSYTQLQSLYPYFNPSFPTIPTGTPIVRQPITSSASDGAAASSSSSSSPSPPSPTENKEVSQILSSSHNLALAMLRTEHIEDRTHALRVLIDGKSFDVIPHEPEWWKL